jgi:hypothetical protein
MTTLLIEPFSPREGLIYLISIGNRGSPSRAGRGRPKPIMLRDYDDALRILLIAVPMWMGPLA